MRSTAILTHPVALCAYVLSLVFGLLARRWDHGNRKQDRQLFYVAVALSVTALVGGLLLAWQQATMPDPNATRRSGQNPTALPATTLVSPPEAVKAPPTGNRETTTQNSKGDQSPNVNGTSGNVTIEFGDSGTKRAGQRR